MPVPVTMPKLGMTMTEGTITRWLVSEGDRVTKGKAIVEIESDKIINELEAPAGGTLTRIILEEGLTTEVAQTIAWIVEDGESASDIPQERSSREAATLPAQADTPIAVVPQDTPEPPAQIGRRAVSPVARRLVKKLGIDLSTITGSGPGGGVVKEDVLRAAESGASNGQSSTVVPLSPMRKAIAQHVTRSAAVPQIVLYAHADASALQELRRKDKSITYDDAIILCVSRTLAGHRYLNASYEETGIRLYSQIDVGLVVAVDEGLAIPVIRGANCLSFREISAQRKRLVERVRSRKVTPEEMANGTFTISNLGMYPVDCFQALLSPPQAAILSIGQIRQIATPADGGGIVFRPTIEFGLTLDHRVVDGAAGAGFLKDFIARIETITLD